MRLLLDTHIWVWSYAQPEQLGRNVRQELDSDANEFWLSPASSWEVALLLKKRRINMQQDDFEHWLDESSKRFREAPITHQIVRIAHELPLPHADPADRFIAATAHLLDLTLVTADDKLLGLAPTIRTLANR